MTIFAALVAAAVELHGDPQHTTAQFAVKHMVVTTVRGEFGKVDSMLDWNKDNPSASKVDLDIDASTVDTHVEKRDNHLKSADFFDVAKCPKITFKSTKIEPAGSDHYKVTGDLTMHCQTHPATLDVAFDGKGIKAPWGPTVYAASATGKINRHDWGLNWNKALESGGVLVSDDVDLNVDIEFVAKPAEAKK